MAQSNEKGHLMLAFAYIDPGTTGLLAQFAAAGLAGVAVFFRARFRKTQPELSPESDSDDDGAGH